mmetsp:Transcript_39803/g.83178  ORF Transcript_39803/g.83178 Transcript_39803/m.83178 type:complete len:87 (+) Transcript_39803:238-498(+)
MDRKGHYRGNGNSRHLRKGFPMGASLPRADLLLVRQCPSKQISSKASTAHGDEFRTQTKEKGEEEGESRNEEEGEARRNLNGGGGG